MTKGMRKRKKEKEGKKMRKRRRREGEMDRRRGNEGGWRDEGRNMVVRINGSSLDIIDLRFPSVERAENW